MDKLKNTDMWRDIDPVQALENSNIIKKYDKLVFEAHSTDYQTKESLRSMVEDGFIICYIIYQISKYH